MNAAFVKLYHHLPPQVRSIAATLHGYGLRSWRYGAESERLVEAALERERWTPRQWRSWQQERLASLLHRAATEVPYYRAHWEARRRRGDRASWESLENWPVLEKEALRAQPRAFVAEGYEVRRMARLHTSGTTGTPLDLWATRQTEREWWALFEARWQRWYGISWHERGAILGGKIVTPISQRRPPFWVWDGARSLLYLSTYHLAPDLIPFYLDALKRYRVQYLRGYASSLYALAQSALRQGRSDLRMKVAVTYAEPLFDYQREAIAAAFQCPVRESYGMVEMTAAASECEAGRLHLWPEAGWIEVLPGAGCTAHSAQRTAHSGDRRSGAVRDARCAVRGALICTGLLNAEMPLIRFRAGDAVALPVDDTPCDCGRTLPLLDSVTGRLDDMVYTPDGRRFGCLDVVHAGLPVREAQVIQEAPNRLRVLYVPAPEFTDGTARAIVRELQGQLGDVEVRLEAVPEVPRGANGKFRMIVCKISPQDRERLLAASAS